jgi:hypothetical protein
MATKSKSIFVTLPEFGEWIRNLQDDLSGSVVLYHGSDRPVTIWQGGDEEVLSVSRLYFVENAPVHDQLTIERLNKGEVGWVQIDVPRVVDEALLLCQIAARSDWWDKQQSVTRENRSTLHLYDKVWRAIKPRLDFPVWATNICTGASSAYRTIGYSKGARDWHLKGGKLAQDGVANIKYEIR